MIHSMDDYAPNSTDVIGFTEVLKDEGVRKYSQAYKYRL